MVSANRFFVSRVAVESRGPETARSRRRERAMNYGPWGSSSHVDLVSAACPRRQPTSPEGLPEPDDPTQAAWAMASTLPLALVLHPSLFPPRGKMPPFPPLRSPSHRAGTADSSGGGRWIMVGGQTCKQPALSMTDWDMIDFRAADKRARRCRPIPPERTM